MFGMIIRLHLLDMLKFVHILIIFMNKIAIIFLPYIFVFMCNYNTSTHAGIMSES